MQVMQFPAPNPAAPVDPREIMRILGPEAFRLTPATLAVRTSNGKWRAAKHLLHLSAIIAQELDKGNARLIVSMPPRHGKSKLISVRTPVWLYDRYPDRQIGLTAYGADLATEFSEEIRDIIMEDQDEEFGEQLLRVQLKTTKINNWTTTKGGRCYAVGVGGTLYGRGVHDLLVDDYYKNVEEAESQAYRDKVYEWFSVIAATRIEPNGSIIIIATRWNVDDLAGRLLSMPNSPWRELRIPGIAEENDPIGRLPGEALWPERYDLEALESWRATMGGYFFDAIVQQHPRKSRSSTFQEHWVSIVEEAPRGKDIIRIRSWDLAGTEDGGDYTSGTKLAIDHRTGKIWVEDQKRERLSPGKVEELVLATAQVDSMDTEIILEQEPGSSGKAVADTYTRLLKGYRVTTARNTGSKFVRAQPFLAACERNDVSLVRGSWNTAWYSEFSAFPDGDHDDQIDSASQAYNKFFHPRTTAGTFGRKAIDATNNRTEVSQKRLLNAELLRDLRLKLPEEISKSVPSRGRSRIFSTTWGRSSN